MWQCSIIQWWSGVGHLRLESEFHRLLKRDQYITKREGVRGHFSVLCSDVLPREELLHLTPVYSLLLPHYDTQHCKYVRINVDADFGVIYHDDKPFTFFCCKLADCPFTIKSCNLIRIMDAFLLKTQHEVLSITNDASVQVKITKAVCIGRFTFYLMWHCSEKQFFSM